MEEKRRRDPNGYIRRPEFEEHESNPFAHTALINRVLQENLRLREQFENRLGSLEKLQQRIIGAVSVLSLLFASGVIGVVIQFLRGR